MIDRYSTPHMSYEWSEANKWRTCLMAMTFLAASKGEKDYAVELNDMVSKMETTDYANAFVSCIKTREIETRHDFVAFLETVEDRILPEHRHLIHCGLTSSDVLDTALSIQIAGSSDLIGRSFAMLRDALKVLAREHDNTVCAGRTHGQYAQKTTFGYKLDGYSAAIERAHHIFKEASDHCRVFKFAGPVGRRPQERPVNRAIAKAMGASFGGSWCEEPFPTQIIPRDRHAAMISGLALLATTIEGLAMEIRHLSRPEIMEVSEGRRRGAKGSSSMPHKINPVGSENLCGLARVVRSMADIAMENVVTWHERDISHSSAERYVFPVAFGTVAFMLERMTSIIDNLEVYEARISQNVEDYENELSTNNWLTFLQRTGCGRKAAHEIVERYSKIPDGLVGLCHIRHDEVLIGFELTEAQANQIAAQ